MYDFVYNIPGFLVSPVNIVKSADTPSQSRHVGDTNFAEHVEPFYRNIEGGLAGVMRSAREYRRRIPEDRRPARGFWGTTDPQQARQDFPVYFNRALEGLGKFRAPGSTNPYIELQPDRGSENDRRRAVHHELSHGAQYLHDPEAHRDSRDSMRIPRPPDRYPDPQYYSRPTEIGARLPTIRRYMADIHGVDVDDKQKAEESFDTIRRDMKRFRSAEPGLPEDDGRRFWFSSPSDDYQSDLESAIELYDHPKYHNLLPGTVNVDPGDGRMKRTASVNDNLSVANALMKCSLKY